MSNKNTKVTYYSPKWISRRLDDVIDSTIESIGCFCVDPVSSFTRNSILTPKPSLNSFLYYRLTLYQVKFLIILLLQILIFHQYLLFLNVEICYILKFLNLSTEDSFLPLIICPQWMVTISLHRMVLISISLFYRMILKLLIVRMLLFVSIIWMPYMTVSIMYFGNQELIYQQKKWS